MKHFQSVYNTFAILGIRPNQLQQKHLLNCKIFVVYIWYILIIVLECVSLFHRTYSFEEYTYIILTLAVAFVIITCYTLIIFNMTKLFQILDRCEKIIDKSKYKNNFRACRRLTINSFLNNYFNES